MPFVRIDALPASGDRLGALSRAAHDALTETIGSRPDDRFQVLASHDGSGNRQCSWERIASMAAWMSDSRWRSG